MLIKISIKIYGKKINKSIHYGNQSINQSQLFVDQDFLHEFGPQNLCEKKRPGIGIYTRTPDERSSDSLFFDSTSSNQRNKESAQKIYSILKLAAKSRSSRVAQTDV